MKSNSLLALLVGALWVCSLVTLFVATRYYFTFKQQQDLQSHVMGMTRTRNAAQALIYEARTYSKTHPALVALLQQYELAERMAATNVPAPSPAKAVQP
jgi:hypothetical protein